MLTDSIDFAVFTEAASDTTAVDVLETCRDVGFDVDDYEDDIGAQSDFDYKILTYDDWELRLQFDASPDRDPTVPAILIGLFDHLDPDTVATDQLYNERLTVLFELFCRITIEINGTYALLFDESDRGTAALPIESPYHESITQPPAAGFFQDELLSSLGGLDEVYETTPWCTGELTTGQTLVIETALPWGERGWVPPTDAEYIDTATLHTDVAEAGGLTLGDPFAELEPGEYGADIVIPQNDLDGEFDNDAAELVRVYVDENYNLRRIEDDSFVRNVVTDATGTERQIIDRMAADRPPGVDAEDVPLSVLVNDDVPAEFVRLETPTGENVVTHVMNIDVSMSKYDVLMALVNRARPDEGYTDEELASIEGGLETLVDTQSSVVAEAWIRDNVL